MEKNYQVTSVEIRDSYQFSGQTIQNYSIALEGVEGWILLGQRENTPPPKEGDTLYGRVEDKVAKSGKAYKRFKKVNPEYGGSRSDNQTSGNTGEIGSKLDYIISLLEGQNPNRDVAAVEEQTQDTPLVSNDEDPFEGMF